MSGVFAVSREIFDHDFFADEPYSEREAWLWLIGDAAWRSCRIRRGRAVVDLSRGQLAVSMRTIADRWRWSKSRVDRFFDRLSSEGMIAVAGTTGAAGCTVITICNYDAYQFGGDAEEGAGHCRDISNAKTGTLAGQKNSNKNNDLFEMENNDRDTGGTLGEPKAGHLYREEDNNKNNTPISLRDMPPKSGDPAAVARLSSPKANKGTSIPEDWTFGEDERLVAEKFGFAGPRGEALFASFHDHWTTSTTKTAVKKNWPTAWRMWCRKQAEYDAEREARNNRFPPKPPDKPKFRNGFAEILYDMHAEQQGFFDEQSSHNAGPEIIPPDHSEPRSFRAGGADVFPAGAGSRDQVVVDFSGYRTVA